MVEEGRREGKSRQHVVPQSDLQADRSKPPLSGPYWHTDAVTIFITVEKEKHGFGISLVDIIQDIQLM